MRLAYLVSRYPYASHVFILREVQALRRAGEQIDTFTVRRPEARELLSPEDRQANASTHTLLPARPLELMAAHLRALLGRPGRYLGTLRRALGLRGPGARATLWQIFYFGEAVLLWRECRRRGIRHIHAHHANVASDVALLAAELGGRHWSWSFTMHGSTEFFDVREHRLARKAQLSRFVVCVSDHGRSQIMALIPSEHWHKLRVVRCGLDVSAFRPAPSRPTEAVAQILTVGRLVPVKGHALLIGALAQLATEGVQARLTIVGYGPALGELQAHSRALGVSELVTFAGAVGQHEIRSYYGRADVFALTSFAEGLPVVLVEAMATGLPVVATQITGIPELVQHEVSGLLVTPGRQDELAAALSRLLGEPPERRRAMGMAGREKVVSEFDLDHTTERLRAVFAELVPAIRSG